MAKPEKVPEPLSSLVNPNSNFEKIAHGTVVGTIGLAILTDGIKHLTPTAEANAIVCGIFALILMSAFVIPVREKQIKKVSQYIGLAFLTMTILYFLKIIASPYPKIGYDAITDGISSMLFMFVWLLLVTREKDAKKRLADKAAILIVFLLLLGSMIAKFVFDVKLGTASTGSQSARTLINLSNGIILLSLYAQLRRTFQSPDPFTHIFILLYGGLQISAENIPDFVPGPPSFTTMTSLFLKWILLLGKVFFGGYIVFLLLPNLKLTSKTPRL